MKKIILASSNPGKLRELNAILQSVAVQLVPQSEFDIASVAETGLTFVENALLKARHAAQETGLAAIADDSGLAVDALQGKPGIYSARFAGEKASDQDNIEQLLSELGNTSDRGAHFHSTIVYLRHAKDPVPVICQGEWFGEIALKPHGTQGFGYDPVFFDPQQQCTAAELARETKNRISHRGKALQQLLQYFNNHEF